MGTRDDEMQVKERQPQLISLTADFCKAHLDQEYADLAAKLVDRLSQQQLVLYASGRIEIWAAAVIHALCQINAGFEAEQPVHTKPDVIASYFGAAKGTITVKAKEIRDALGLSRWGDDEFSTTYMRENNPIKMMQQLMQEMGLGGGFAHEASDDDALTLSYSLSDEEMMQVLGISSDQMQAMMHYSPETEGYTLELTEEQVNKLQQYLSQREGITIGGDADEDADEDDVEYHTVAELRSALGLTDEQIAALTTYDPQSGEYYLNLSAAQEEQIAAYHQRLIDRDRLN